jgi:hypothetical protein
MRTSMIRTVIASLAVVFSLGVAPEKANAAFVLNGCAGGTFGSACGLNELLSGGNFSVNDTQFTNWALSLGSLNPSLIRVDPLDSFSSPGFTLTDTGNTLRATGGSSTSNILSFNAVRPLGLRNNTLGVQFGQMANPGEFTFAEVSETVFNSAFSLIGNNDVLCDTATCANSTRLDSASFANQSSLLVFTNIDVASGAVGDVAQINSITIAFAVPEPGTIALLMIGLAALLSRRRVTRFSTR